MTWLDFLIAAIVLFFLIRGVWIGFIRQLASLLALILSFVMAGRFYGESANFVFPFIENQQFGFLLAYLLVFIITFFAVILLGQLLKTILTVSLLGWFDSLLGGVFGLAKALFVSCLLFIGLSAFISGSSNFFRQSFFYPYLNESTSFFLTLVRDKKLRDGMLPRTPAISSFIDSSIEFGKVRQRDSQ